MKFRFVILAAGKGTRMNANVPKALVKIGEKPILEHLYDSIKSTGIEGDPIVVVGKERIRLADAFNGECDYAVQEDQKGTAHAVHCAKEQTQDADAVIVLYGDHPFVSSQTLSGLTKLHGLGQGPVTMMTTTIDSFDDWRKTYLHWGRVLRDEDGFVVGIREYKDATDSERLIQELNPSFFCFDTKWLWENISKIKNNNRNEEYYLTDLVELAVEQGHKISSLPVLPEEAMGVNTQEEKEIAEELLRRRKES
jgi:bifunctional UDP-N-acetylglucosamine pyrophosphorylase / glucosamine-1-phosphate N-acetyltransferase